MFRDPPHYLKALRTTTTPKRLLWLATTGHTRKRREHYETHFQAAALGKTWYTTRRNEQRNTIETFDAPAELWDAVAAWCPTGRRVVMFSYDLAEQMRLAQMLTHLPQDGWQLDKIVLERTAAWCLLRKGGRSLLCCDLRSWAPVPWEKLVVDTIPNDTRNVTVNAGPRMRHEIATYRASVIRAAVLQILRWIDDERLGPFRPTGSGQSYAAYRRRFIFPRLLVHDDTARLLAERGAMHAGRAEAWRHGKQPGGPFVEYDLHSAYATVGRDCEVPAVARGEIRHPTVARVESALDRYTVLADVTVDTSVECLPYRIGERTVWPIGRFRTLIWEPELRLALRYCNDVRINHAYLYTRAPALRDFCGWVLHELDSPDSTAPPVARRVLKHWSRCLVGRMGLRYRQWINFGPLDPPDVRLVEYLDLDDGTSTEMLHAGTTRLLLGELTEARESMPQIPGWIMSEARRRLWVAMLTYAPMLTYVDTDSIILACGRVKGDNYPSQLHEQGGDWIRKGVYPALTIHGPRNLEVGYSRRVSGLPLSARQTAPLEFSGEVMRGVKRAMRNGELDLVVSMPRTFHLDAVDLRRQHNPDGSTKPYEVLEV